MTDQPSMGADAARAALRSEQARTPSAPRQRPASFTKRDARREALGMAAAHLRIGLEIGEFTDLLEDDPDRILTETQVTKVLNEIQAIADRLSEQMEKLA